jgi:hypothetical protein
MQCLSSCRCIALALAPPLQAAVNPRCCRRCQPSPPVATSAAAAAAWSHSSLHVVSFAALQLAELGSDMLIQFSAWQRCSLRRPSATWQAPVINLDGLESRKLPSPAS